MDEKKFKLIPLITIIGIVVLALVLLILFSPPQTALEGSSYTIDYPTRVTNYDNFLKARVKTTKVRCLQKISAEFGFNENNASTRYKECKNIQADCEDMIDKKASELVRDYPANQAQTAQWASDWHTNMQDDFTSFNTEHGIE
jgi:hypothetical protein